MVVGDEVSVRTRNATVTCELSNRQEGDSGWFFYTREVGSSCAMM
jgi:hypothetical protein